MTPEAIENRENIYNHIEAGNPIAALDIDESFEEKAALLLGHPNLGRIGRIAGTRELVMHPNYILIYDVIGHVVRVLNVVHAARQWPSIREWNA